MLTQTLCAHCGAVNRIAAGHEPRAAKCGRCSKSLELDSPLEVDDQALASHLQDADGLVLVDVWAPWCGPCRAMAPNFAEAARLMAGEARLLKLNADTSATVSHLGVSGVPALLLFRNGRIIARTAGLMRADALVRWVRQHAASSAEFQST
jgi:thioredoxin 2